MTYTFVNLAVSRRAFDEIATKLREAKYDHCFHGDEQIDMHGLALVPDSEDVIPTPAEGAPTPSEKPFYDALEKLAEPGGYQRIMEQDGAPPAAPGGDEAERILNAELEQEEEVGWVILQALHIGVPESERPDSWSDMDEKQERRIRQAARAAIAQIRRAGKLVTETGTK